VPVISDQRNPSITGKLGGGWDRLRTAPWFGLMALGLTIAAVARLRMSDSADTMWAEDGQVFLTGAINGTPLLEPYAGYLHLAPRLMASATARMPADLWAIGLTAGCCLAYGVIGVVVYVSTATLPLSLVGRVALALIPVMVPMAPREILANTANLHWFLLWLAPWLFLARPRTWRTSIGLAAVTLVSTLTEIQMLLFAPLLLLWLRDRRRWPIAAAALLGLGAQVLATINHPRQSISGHASTTSLIEGYALQVGGGAFVSPLDHILGFVSRLGLASSFVFVVPFLVAAATWAVYGPRPRWLAAMLVAASIAVWTIAFRLNAGPPSDWSTFAPERILLLEPIRYAAVPAMYLLATAVLALDCLIRRPSTNLRSHRVRAILGTILGIALTITVILSVDYRGQTRKSAGPEWRTTIGVARGECSHSKNADARVIIAPDPKWSITIPCTRLTDR